MLYDTFFPRSNPPEDEDCTAEYPPARFEMPKLTATLVRDVLQGLRKFKAPGVDDIPNAALVWGREVLALHLARIYQATFDVEHWSVRWRLTRTPVLRKPGKTHYNVPNAFRPITLGVNIAKAGVACVTAILVHQVEKLGLLPKTHFLGRPGRATTDALHYLSMLVKNAWRAGKVASILFLDVKAAFPSVDATRLYHNLRLRGFPSSLVQWLKRKMTGRQTTLEFDGFVSDPFELTGCLEQGCPLSVLLYQVYNSPLLESAKEDHGEFITGNIDDVAVLAIGDDFNDTHHRLRSFMNRNGGAFQWARTHSSCFSVEKFGLVNCSTRRRDGGLGPSLLLGPGLPTVSPVKSHKFLGVHIDHKLRWKEQVDLALKKGMQWVALFKRMAGTRNGIPMRIAKRLYLSMAVPSMLYAADVFLIPTYKHPSKRRIQGSAGPISRLGRVHRQALIMMTGALKTTATDVIEVHAHIIPFPLIVEQHCHRAAVRACTLPPEHPLSPLLLRAATRHVKRHRSVMHHLLDFFHLDLRFIETINPIHRSPTWRAGWRVLLADSKEEAIFEEGRLLTRTHDVRIYSDGSDIDGGVGAAATLYRGRRRKTLHFHLGPSNKHTVYEAELVGMLLALELLRTETHMVRDASVALDNQAAVRSSGSRESGPGQYLLNHIHRLKREVKKAHPDIKLTIRWVPGHMGVEGNEDVDNEAKRAAQGHSSPKAKLPLCLHNELPRSASRLKQDEHSHLASQAQELWQTSPRYRNIRRIDSSLPSKSYMRLVEKLPRRHAALLFQLRSGHIPLNKHLHRINCTPSPRCPACDERDETVEHFLLHCPAYDRMRQRMFYEHGTRTRSLHHLLNSKSMLTPLFQYIQATGRFRGIVDVTPRKRGPGGGPNRRC